MSEWYEVRNYANVELSDDKLFVEILFDTDCNGNRYVEVPVEMLVRLFSDNATDDVSPLEDFLSNPDRCICTQLTALEPTVNPDCPAHGSLKG